MAAWWNKALLTQPGNDQKTPNRKRNGKRRNVTRNDGPDLSSAPEAFHTARATRAVSGGCDVDIHVSLFTLKSCKSVSGFRKVVPFSHRTSVRAVVYDQCKAVFVMVSLFPRCAVGDVDRCVQVQEPAIFSCPFDFGLGCTVYAFNSEINLKFMLFFLNK